MSYLPLNFGTIDTKNLNIMLGNNLMQMLKNKFGADIECYIKSFFNKNYDMLFVSETITKNIDKKYNGFIDYVAFYK